MIELDDAFGSHGDPVPREPIARHAFGLLVAVVSVATAGLVTAALLTVVPFSDPGMIVLIAVLLTAVYRGLWPSIAASVPATLRVSGERYDVGPKRKRLAIDLPARPKVGFLRIPFVVTADGPKQPSVREQLLILRI